MKCIHHGCKKPPTITKKPIENHEKTCFYNPDRRSCKICFWYQVGDSIDELGHEIITNVCTNPDNSFSQPEMYKKKGICYDCDGFDQYGPEL